jgi:AraC family transcriptional regulator of adaptative response/methylated-DNA-[protein]-cysteine methyltransferase
MTPATYGRGGDGATIDWITGATPIGRVLVAATARGVCFVEVGESDRALRAALAAEFPRATIAPGPAAGLAAWLETTRAVASARGRLAGAADRRARHGVSVAGLARARRDSARRDARRTRKSARALGRPGARPGRGAGRARTNPLGAHRAVSPGGAGERRRPGRVPLGRAVKRALLDAERRK